LGISRRTIYRRMSRLGMAGFADGSAGGV